jgi:hypothetical protein
MEPEPTAGCGRRPCGQQCSRDGTHQQGGRCSHAFPRSSHLSAFRDGLRLTCLPVWMLGWAGPIVDMLLRPASVLVRAFYASGASNSHAGRNPEHVVVQSRRNRPCRVVAGDGLGQRYVTPASVRFRSLAAANACRTGPRRVAVGEGLTGSRFPTDCPREQILRRLCGGADVAQVAGDLRG